MKISLFFVFCAVAIATLGAAVTQSFIHTNESFVMETDNSSDIGNSMTLASYESSSSYSYQQSNINLSAQNLQQSHILSIHTSGSTITGTVTVNGKVVKQLQNNEIDIELSPYLSVGTNRVEISGNYAPKSSTVSVEFNALGANMNQQISGAGIIDSQLNIIID